MGEQWEPKTTAEALMTIAASAAVLEALKVNPDLTEAEVRAVADQAIRDMIDGTPGDGDA